MVLRVCLEFNHLRGWGKPMTQEKENGPTHHTSLRPKLNLRTDKDPHFFYSSQHTYKSDIIS
jgi:hypothetical protein